MDVHMSSLRTLMHVLCNKASSFLVCIGVSNPPQKHHLSLFHQASLISTNFPSLPLFRQFFPIYSFFVNLPLKIGFFSQPPQFFILNSIPSFTVLILNCDRKTFFYNLFLSLNILDVV